MCLGQLQRRQVLYFLLKPFLIYPLKYKSDMKVSLVKTRPGSLTIVTHYNKKPPQYNIWILRIVSWDFVIIDTIIWTQISFVSSDIHHSKTICGLSGFCKVNWANWKKKSQLKKLIWIPSCLLFLNNSSHSVIQLDIQIPTYSTEHILWVWYWVKYWIYKPKPNNFFVFLRNPEFRMGNRCAKKLYYH